MKEQQFNITRECLTRHAESAIGNQVAMVFVEGDLTHKDLTYRELDELSARFSASFKKRGLQTGDRVLLRLPNSYVFPAAFFGALRGGFIPVPTSPMLTGSELEYLIQDSGAAALVTDEKVFSALRGHCNTSPLKAVYCAGVANTAEVSVEAELAGTIPDREIHPSLRTDPAYLVYTSGTTGYPKGVLHAQQALLGRLPAATQWFSFTGNDRILHSGKFNWTYVLGTAMMDPLFHGKTVVVYEGENSPTRWIELIQKFGCNIFIGVPTIFRQILQKTATKGSDVPTLKHAMCAGEHLTDEVLGGWTERFGFPIYEGLGMSECSYYISQRKGDVVKPNSAGKIQDGHKVALLDENLQPVAAGQEAMLCIHRDDPGLFLEYWQAPEANQKQFRDGWFLTGDYAIQDTDGNIFFLGRRDEIIKSFGYRVSPFEIERVYRDCPAVEDVVAFAEQLGPEKTLISMCVLIKPGRTFEEAELLQWGKDRLASYKVPRKLYTLDKFPRSANGKVLRNQISKALGI
ncbi:MAG: acyl-CoA synthetase [Turneriella sp.]